MEDQKNDAAKGFLWVGIFAMAMLFWAILSYIFTRLAIFLGMPEQTAVETVPLATLLIPVILVAIVWIITKVIEKRDFKNM